MEASEVNENNDPIDEVPTIPIPYVSGKAAHDILRKNLELSLGTIPGIDVTMDEYGTFYKVKETTMAFISHSLPSEISSYIEHHGFYTTANKINHKRVC